MRPLGRFFLFVVLFLPLQILYAQTCQTDFPVTTPTKRFEIKYDTVYDTQTGLSWKRCLQGLSGIDCDQGAVLSLNWQQALLAAEAEIGWRLPNINELQSIIERQCVDPALNTQVFSGNRLYVWSSTPAYDGTSAWVINFGIGNTGAIRTHGYAQVWLVRSGQ